MIDTHSSVSNYEVLGRVGEGAYGVGE